MREIYPLKFETIFKDKVWGGDRIKTVLGKDFSPLPNCGEAWELTTVKDNVSVVKNGFLAGNALDELAEIYMADLVGEKVFENYGVDFPLLFKFIDTNDYLSIQVHPGDNIAQKRHQGPGKTEMWYVLHAEPGAEIITGFKKDISRKEYLCNLENKTLKNILNIEKAKRGDVYYIPPGRVHAIGAGVTLAEIQQSSDLTYRIYDWDRPDSDGNHRELHTDLALDVIDFKAYPQYKTDYRENLNQSAELVKCPYFTTNLTSFDKKIECDYYYLDSFVVIMCIEGQFSIVWQDGEDVIYCGDTVLIPAEMKNLKMVPSKPSKFLETYIA